MSLCGLFLVQLETFRLLIKLLFDADLNTCLKYFLQTDLQRGKIVQIIKIRCDEIIAMNYEKYLMEMTRSHMV